MAASKAVRGLGQIALGLGFCALSCRSRDPRSSVEPSSRPSSAVPGLAAPKGELEPEGVPQARPAALLELFTSEGCSSCPAADETLALLTDEAARQDQRVFTLELHVDYWNDLGWVDPFSDPAFSQRQSAYARKLNSNRIYTPQLVVNGTEELVGSNRAGARAAIARALQAQVSAAVALTARQVDGAIELRYRVSSSRPVELVLAVADDVAETRVTAGENSERLLRHRHVVRAFRSMRLNASGAGLWSAPWQRAPGHGAVFVAAYATDPQTLQVLGADAQLLPGPA